MESHRKSEYNFKILLVYLTLAFFIFDTQSVLSVYEFIDKFSFSMRKLSVITNLVRQHIFIMALSQNLKRLLWTIFAWNCSIIFENST